MLPFLSVEYLTHFEATGMHVRMCVCVCVSAHAGRGDEIGKGRRGERRAWDWGKVSGQGSVHVRKQKGCG